MAANDLEIVDKGAGKKKLLLIVGVLLLLVAGAGGYFFFMGGSDSAASAEGEAQVAGGANARAIAPEMQGSAIYVRLPRPFIFNVAGASRDRLVQIRVELLVRGEGNQALAMRHIPLIEATLLANFSASSADELITATGKEEMKNKALIDLQTALLEVAGSVVVAEVLFTSFVMQ